MKSTSNEPEFVPSRPGPAWTTRARQRAFEALPLLVWCAAVAVLCELLRGRMPTVPIKAEAAVLRYGVIPRFEGELLTLAVHERQLVEAGQVVGHLRDDWTRLEVSRVKFELDALRADLHSEHMQLEAQNQLTAHELVADQSGELRKLYRDLEAARLDSLVTKAEIEESRVRQQGIAIELRRQTELDQKGIASGSLLTQLETEDAALQKRVAELEGVLAGHRERVQAGQQRLDTFVGSKPVGFVDQEAILDPFRWRIRAQEALLEQVALVVSQHRLVSPATGVVEQIHYRPGQWLVAGLPLMTIVESKPREIIAYVPEQLRSTVKQATTVMVERSDAPGQMRLANVLGSSSALVLLPPRLWNDPRVEEWALAVYLEPSGDEIPGQKLFVHWR